MQFLFRGWPGAPSRVRSRRRFPLNIPTHADRSRAAGGAVRKPNHTAHKGTAFHGAVQTVSRTAANLELE